MVCLSWLKYKKVLKIVTGLQKIIAYHSVQGRSSKFAANNLHCAINVSCHVSLILERMIQKSSNQIKPWRFGTKEFEKK